MATNKSVPEFKEITSLSGPDLLHIVVGNVDKKLQWSNAVAQIDDDLNITSQFSSVTTSITTISGQITTINGQISTINSTISTNDGLALHKAGSEIVTGLKTFSVSPIVPNPTNNTDAANKQWVLSVLPTGYITGGGSSGNIPLFDAAKNIVNSRISQSSTTITLPSPDGNTNITVSNGDASIGLSNSHVYVLSESVQLNWHNGTISSDISLQDTATSISHTFLITLDAPSIYLPTSTANRVLITDGNKYVKPSSITDTELGRLSGVTSSIQTQINGKVTSNSGISGATKTKITYDSKGLVTGGADATTADIADSTDKRYVTDAQIIAINNIDRTAFINAIIFG